LQISVVSS